MAAALSYVARPPIPKGATAGPSVAAARACVRACARACVRACVRACRLLCGQSAKQRPQIGRREDERRCRCGSGERSPGADVAAASAVTVQMWQRVGPVPTQM